VHEMQLQTIVNSNQHLPLSDPERDNCDWLGDGHLAAETAATFLDAGAFYLRSLEVLGDVDAHCAAIAGAGNLYTIPYIIPAELNAAPCQGYIQDRPGFEWEVAYAVFLDVLAVHYNNSRAIAASYAGVELLVRSVQHLVDAEGGVLKANVWGDWANQATGITSDICTCGILPPYVYKNDSSRPCACQGTTTPNSMGGAWTAAFYYIYAADALARWAATIGDAARAAEWTSRRDVAGAAFGAAFVQRDPADGSWFVDGGTRECVRCMGAAAMALMAPSAAVMNATARAGVCAHLAAAVDAKGGRLDTGVLSTRWLLPAMSTCGLWDAALGVLTSVELPSYGFWLSRGLTTTAEQWWEEGTPEVTGGALSHPMYSTTSSWLVSGLCGIALADVMTSSPAAPFAIAPAMPAALEAAAGAVETARGRVAASWAQSLGEPLSLALNVSVPPGAAARVVVPFPRAGAGAAPAVAVDEGGAPVFARGAFVPGVAGIAGAVLVPPTALFEWWSVAVDVAVGGDFAFVARAE
jgi:Bacterial alpha-L-rhamnosidase 6 hairpin glycosidase domain/Bacterial alpha-L-rhamnosidase C-terminal domain